MNSNQGGGTVYVPVLKWKRGEQTAVETLTSTQKDAVMPIAELQERPYDWEKEKYTKSWDQHIEAVATATAKYWGTTHEIAFDQGITESDKLSATAETVWEHLFHALWSKGVRAVPVVSSLAMPKEVAALKKAGSKGQHARWTLRYVRQEAVTPAVAARWFQTTLAALGTPAANVDAVLDLEYVADWDVPKRAAEVAACLAAIGSVAPWRSLVLSSGAFLANLAGIMPGAHQIHRTDWALFKAVRQQPGMPDSVIYSDYGVSHILAFDADPRMMKMSANLRYTHDERWFVFKARSVKDFGFEQYRDLCKILVALNPPYMGVAFSRGDANYDKVAGSGVGPGNATNWRRDATNHHIHFALWQIANLPAP